MNIILGFLFIACMFFLFYGFRKKRKGNKTDRPKRSLFQLPVGTELSVVSSDPDGECVFRKYTAKRGIVTEAFRGPFYYLNCGNLRLVRDDVVTIIGYEGNSIILRKEPFKDPAMQRPALRSALNKAALN